MGIVGIDSNRHLTYETHIGTPTGGGMGIATPSPHISSTGYGENIVKIGDMENGSLNFFSPKNGGMNFYSSIYCFHTYFYLPRGPISDRMSKNFSPLKLDERSDTKKISNIDIGKKLNRITERPDVGKGVAPCTGNPKRDDASGRIVLGDSLTNASLVRSNYLPRQDPSVATVGEGNTNLDRDGELVKREGPVTMLSDDTRTVADAEEVEAQGCGPCFRRFEFARPPQIKAEIDRQNAITSMQEFNQESGIDVHEILEDWRDHPEDVDIGECEPGFPPEDI